MAYSYVRYEAVAGVQNYTFSFGYLDQSHIQVRLNGTLTTAYTFLNSSTIQFTTAPEAGVQIEIRRVTPKNTPIVDFQDGSVILEKDLDLLATFNLYVSQETDDTAASGLFVSQAGTYDAGERRVSNVSDPINPQDAVTKNYIENLSTSQLTQAIQINQQSQQLLNEADSLISAFTVSTSAPTGGTDGDVWFKVNI